MSRYINWADLSNKYPDSAKYGGGAEELKTSFINDAEDEVDARLAVRYTTPFTPVPGIVRSLCIDLAYYAMTIRQPTSENLYKRIMDRFAAISSGTIVLTVSGTVIGGSDRAWASDSARTSFGPDSPENWSVSRDLVEQYRDARDGD